MAINLGSAYGTIEIGTDGAERNIASLSKTLGNVGKGLSLGVTAPLAGIGTMAIKTAADFETSLNTIQVVSGATGDQMQTLSDLAIQLGADTVFSAGEAAEAMLELSKAGLSAEQVAGAIAGTMDLAAAGGIDLAQAAEITANAINAFGLQATDAEAVANTFAAAANASSVEVHDLAMGFQMAGAVFASNQQSVDDLAAALAILGNNGLKGSDAGTSLKTMMMRLAAPTHKAAAAITELGIQVYNADGSMRGFGDIIGSIEAATVGMSDAQRNAAFTTIFGADAIRAATILTGEGAAAFRDMQGAVTEQGAAAAVAQARMSGVAGAIEQFKGALESAMISGATPFSEKLREIILWAADLITRFTQLSPETQQMAVVLGAVAAAAGPVLLALSGIAAAVGALLSPVGLVVAAVAGLGVAWTTNFLGIRDKTLAAWAAVQPALSQWATWLQSQLPGAMATLQTAMTTGWASVQAHSTQAWTGIQAGWSQLMALLAPGIERVQAAFATFQHKMAALTPKFGELGDAIGNLWTAVQPILSALGQLIAAVFGVASVAVVNGFAAALEAAADIFTIALDGAINSINYIADTLTNTVQLIQAIIAGDWQTAWDEAGQIVADTGQYFADTWHNLKALVETIFTAIKDTVVNTLEDMGVEVGTLLDSLQSTWQRIWGALKDGVQPVIDIIGRVKDAVQGFVDWIGGISIPNPFAGLGDAIGGIKDKLGGVLPGFAKGTSYAPGGLATLHERGQEAVLLPRGAKVLTAPQTKAAAAGVGGPVITINMPVQVVDQGLDMYTLAYTVADVIKRRVR